MKKAVDPDFRKSISILTIEYEEILKIQLHTKIICFRTFIYLFYSSLFMGVYVHMYVFMCESVWISTKMQGRRHLRAPWPSQDRWMQFCLGQSLVKGITRGNFQALELPLALWAMWLQQQSLSSRESLQARGRCTNILRMPRAAIRYTLDLFCSRTGNLPV